MSGVEDAAYHLNEGVLPLDVPGTWEDKTMHVLRMPGHGHAAASLVVTREMLPLGQDVAGYAAAEIGRMAELLPDFQDMGRLPIEWTDRTGEAILTRWRAEEGVMDQIICCRQAEGRRLIVFTATHPSPMPAPTYHAMVAAIAGFRPREQATDAASATVAKG